MGTHSNCATMSQDRAIQTILFLFCCLFVNFHEVLSETYIAEKEQAKSRMFCSLQLYKEEDMRGESVRIFSSEKISSYFRVQSLKNIGYCCWNIYDSSIKMKMSRACGHLLNHLITLRRKTVQ